MHGLLYRPLPLLPTSLIGRQREVAAAQRILLSAETRLLTLTGPPGVGKTTLAITVARSVLDQFPQGACFVDLAPFSDPADVAPAIADQLDLRPGRGRAAMRLVAALRDEAPLLVLDNFEQVVGAAPLLTELLSSCPSLRILVTSRLPLFLRWERELPVPPLALPDPARSRAANALAAPAVALFVERARAVDPYFEVDEPTLHLVAQICHRLDGLPLAIELAAARARTYPLRAIHQQLLAEGAPGGDGGPLDLLAGGARDLPVRQQTLRQAIGWSYALLQPTERALLRRLAVFVGGSTVHAAQVVSGARPGALASLMEKSLLRRESPPEGEPRVRLLEPIRQFALEQLALAEIDDPWRQHAAFFLALAELAEAGLQGADQPSWLGRLERDHDNLRAALRWAASSGDAETAVRLSGALWRFWWIRGYLDEGMRSLDEALAHAERVTPAARARALHAAGKLARERGDYDRATDLCEASLALFRELHDRAGEALTLNSLANVAGDRGDYDAAYRLYEESLALRRALGDRSGAALALHNLAAITLARGDLALTEALDQESLALFHAAGDEWGLAIGLAHQARTACLRNELERAATLAQESLRLRRTLGDRRGAILCLEIVADVAAASGQALRAARLRGASEALRAQIHFARPPDELAARGADPGADKQRARPELKAAWQAGHALDLEAAIEEALGRPEPAGDRSASGAAELQERTGPTAWIEAVPEIADLADLSFAAAGLADPSSAGGDAASPPLRDPPQARADEVDPGRDESAARAVAPVVQLSRREREIAVLLARGLTNRQLAQELVITEGTAANYVRRVLQRLDLQNRAQVAAWAVEHRLTRPGEPPASAPSAAR